MHYSMSVMSSTCVVSGGGGGGGGGVEHLGVITTGPGVYSQVEVQSSCTVWLWLLPTSQTSLLSPQFSVLSSQLSIIQS